MMQVTFFLDQIDDAAQQVLERLSHPVVIFNGPMGAGKTTFIKALCRTLGITDATSSPTFSLVNEYRTPKGEPVYHFDVYRLKAESEALDMGIEEYLHSGNRCFIEWAEKIPNMLPARYHTFTMAENPDGSRTVKVG